MPLDPTPSGDRVVPILEFHGVGAPLERSHPLAYLHMPVGRCRRRLALLRALGFRGVSVSEAIRRLDGRDGGRGRVVGLAFDDGYRSVVENGLPILREFGFTATCYAVSARLGGWNEWDRGTEGSRRELVTVADLREWCAAGMEVGGHTRTHAYLPGSSDAELADQVRGCRLDLEDVLGAPVTQFAYPWGAHDDRVVAAVRAAGFEGAVTVRRARARASDDRLRLPRIEMRAERRAFGSLLRILGRHEEREPPAAGADGGGAPL